MQLQIHEGEERLYPETFGLYFRDGDEQRGHPGSSTVALVDSFGFGLLLYLDNQDNVISIRNLGPDPEIRDRRLVCRGFRRLAPGSSVTITAGKNGFSPDPLTVVDKAVGRRQ